MTYLVALPKAVSTRSNLAILLTGGLAAD